MPGAPFCSSVDLPKSFAPRMAPEVVLTASAYPQRFSLLRITSRATGSPRDDVCEPSDRGLRYPAAQQFVAPVMMDDRRREPHDMGRPCEGGLGRRLVAGFGVDAQIRAVVVPHERRPRRQRIR